MAIIIQRRKIYSVVYRCKEHGRINLKVEPYFSIEQAEQRKTEIEEAGKEVPLDVSLQMKIRDFVKFHMQMFGKNLLACKTYDAYMAVINNYIYPLIDNDKMEQVDEKYVYEFFLKLKNTKVVGRQELKRDPNLLIRPGTIEKIHVIMKNVFNTAQQCKLYVMNPFYIEIDYGETKKRENICWTEDYIIELLEKCTKTKLFLTMNLMVGCHLCAKEVLGLTWDNVHIEEELYAKNQCYLVLDKELDRISLDSIKNPLTQGIIKVFSPSSKAKDTRLVLMTRFTGTVNVPIPIPVAKILNEWHKVQQEYVNKNRSYQDNQLVIALANGKACEYRVIEKEFVSVNEEIGLPRLKLGQLKNFSMTQGIVQKIYDILVEEKGILNRAIAYKEIKRASAVLQISSKELKDIETNKSESLDIMEIAELLKANPDLKEKFTRLLNL